MPTKINNDLMLLDIDSRAIASAEHRDHTADEGQEAWTVSSYPGRLFTRNQAITKMFLGQRLAIGYGDDDLFVIDWREELKL